MNSIEYIYITENKAAEVAVEHLLTQKRIAYDTETTGLKVHGGESKMLLQQLATEEVSYVFDARKIHPQLLRPVLENRDILKILHNAKFDYQMTKVHTGIRTVNVFDTMLVYRLLTSGLIEDREGGFVPAGFRDKSRKNFPYKGLNFLTQKYLGISLDKSIRENFINMPFHKEFSKAELQYASDDVVVLHPLCDILSSQIMEEGLIETALLEFEFLPACADMELNGVCINQDQWRQIIREAKKYAGQFEAEMTEILAPLSEQNTLFGKSTININSPEQLLDVFRKLGHTLENTDAKALKKVTEGTAGRLAELLLDYKAYKKLISTYGDAILKKINRHTGRLHCTFQQLGADTGRLSSENPNLQNIPNDKEDEEVKLSFRDCFIAPEGKVMLTADYSQCIAENEMISNQWGLVPIQDFEHGGVYTLDPGTGRLEPLESAHKVPSFERSGLVDTDFMCSKGYKDLVQVESDDGFSLICTPDHLLKVVDADGRENWRTAESLKKNDRLVLSRDWIQKDKHRSCPLNEEVALFLGYWIGDGSFSQGGLQIAKGEEKYSDVYGVLNNICQKQLGKDLKNYPNTTAWDLIGKQFHNLWEYLGCSRDWTSCSKEVPKSVLQGGRLVVSSFLRGLFEADGWVIGKNSNHIVAMSTRSEKLSQQVQLLLLSMGVFSKRAAYEEETQVGGRKYRGVQYRVSICDSYNLSKFYEEVGFVSEEKRRILESLVSEPHRSQADYVVLNSSERAALSTAARASGQWVENRRQLFANYFNERGVVRQYTRKKLKEVCTELGVVEVKKHLAFSKVKSISQAGQGEVYDISVPSQRMFVAGGMFVHNCELRILAEVSQDKKFLEIFRNDLDLHIITSQQVFGYTDVELEIYQKVKEKDEPGVDLTDFFTKEEVAIFKKVSDYRSKTKVINFGIVYGLTAFSLSDRFKIPQSEADEILDSYFKTYFGIKRWLDKNAKDTVANRHAKTIIGRKKYFVLADPNNEEDFKRSKRATRRMGNNHVIQGCNADITKRAITDLSYAYENIEGAEILFTVHDEIVSECFKKDAELVANIKANVMRDAFRKFIKTVPVGKNDKVSVSVADHWAK